MVPFGILHRFVLSPVATSSAPVVVGSDGQPVDLRDVLEDGAADALDRLAQDEEWAALLDGLGERDRLRLELVGAGWTVEEVAVFEEA